MRSVPLVLVATVALVAGCSSSPESVSSSTSTVNSHDGVPPGYPVEIDVWVPLVINPIRPEPIPVTGRMAALPLTDDNVPYEIDDFTFVGSTATDAFVRGPSAGERTNQLPLNDDVVNFREKL